MVTPESTTPHRIELPTEFAVGTVNAYLFTGPEPVLVDTGVKSAASLSALQEGLARHNLQISDLKRVIVTHPHVDHCGMAAAIAETSGASVWISELGRAWLVDFPGMWQKRIDYYTNQFIGSLGFDAGAAQMTIALMSAMVNMSESVPPEKVNTFTLDETIEIGGRSWQVVHTPGHATAQTCFYCGETRQLLSADMLLAKAPTPIVERPPSGVGRIPSLPLFLDSLDVVEALEIDQVYPGHGAPFAAHRQVIKKQRQRIHRRKDECYELVAEGFRTVAELVDQMYSHLPLHSRFAGLWMLIGYLDLLKAEGKVIEGIDKGILVYEPADVD